MTYSERKLLHGIKIRYNMVCVHGVLIYIITKYEIWTHFSNNNSNDKCLSMLVIANACGEIV